MGVFAYKKKLGRTETRTRDMMYCQLIRTVLDTSPDYRARIATCSLRTARDRFKENYSIDVTRISHSREPSGGGKTKIPGNYNMEQNICTKKENPCKNTELAGYMKQLKNSMIKQGMRLLAK